MNIQRIVVDNIPSIISVILVAVILVKLWGAGRKDSVKEVLYSLVTKAEVEFGNGVGTVKYAQVVEGLYRILPPIVTFFISDKELDSMIEEAVQKMKNVLSPDASIVRDLIVEEECFHIDDCECVDEVTIKEE